MNLSACAASVKLAVHKRKAMTVRALAGAEPISALAARHDVSRSLQPLLTGIDAASTYCYLLAAEDYRDGATWAIHLLDLQAQGLKPDYIIADAGTGLRAGQKLAWPDTPCHGTCSISVSSSKL